MAWVMEQESTTTGTDRLVLLSLANHANDHYECWPGIETIMREAGIVRRQTVKTSLGRLEARGLLRRDINACPDVRIPRDRRPNLYVLAVQTGAREPLARGHASRSDGGTLPVGTGARFPCPKPSVEPSVEPSAARTAAPAAFVEWFKIYPRSDGKIAAEKAWNRAIGSSRKVTADSLTEALRTQVKIWNRENRDPKMVPYAQKWLNNRTWEDDAIARPSARNDDPAAGCW